MIVLPEILENIAPYLDAESHLACASVYRDWRKSSADIYGHHIRHLTVTNNAALLAALDSNLTDLLSLTMQTFPNTSDTLSEGFSKSLIGDNPFASGSGASRWKTMVSREMFASHYRRSETACTRASWLLVLENPGLQHLVFEWNWHILCLEVNWGADKYRKSVPPPELMAKGFLDRVFGRLTSVRHVNIGFYIDNYLLSNLPTLCPTSHQIEQLRACVVAFPNLRHFSILRFKNDKDGYIGDDDGAENGGVNMETPTNVLEYPSLESFAFTSYRSHTTKLLNSQVRFPRTKKMRLYSKIVGPISEFASAEEEDKEEIVIHSIRVLALQSAEVYMPRMHAIIEDDGHEMVDLLIEDTIGLKTCEGSDHVVLAEDLIERAEWSCVGLEKLDIEVFDVPRPTRDQEKLLDKLWSLDPLWLKAATDGATTVGEL
ncbi:hypothetical protein BGZ47_007694 [Haplosporangium gracile]|nr:hypothetical protein BGZ47_007694 [Haplosporangium gracile]